MIDFTVIKWIIQRDGGDTDFVNYDEYGNTLYCTPDMALHFECKEDALYYIKLLERRARNAGYKWRYVPREVEVTIRSVQEGPND